MLERIRVIRAQGAAGIDLRQEQPGALGDVLIFALCLIQQIVARRQLSQRQRKFRILQIEVACDRRHDAFQYRIEILARDAVQPNRVMKCGVQGVRVYPRQRQIQLLLPRLQRTTLIGGLARFVRHVVADAHKGVEGRHRAALSAGQQAKSVVEIASLAPGQFFAVTIRLSQAHRGRGGRNAVLHVPPLADCRPQSPPQRAA